MAPLEHAPPTCGFWKQVDFEPCATMVDIENKSCGKCELCLTFLADVVVPEITVMDSQEEDVWDTVFADPHSPGATADPHVGSSAESSSSSLGAHSDLLLPADSDPMPATQVPETQAYPEDTSKRQKTCTGPLGILGHKT